MKPRDMDHAFAIGLTFGMFIGREEVELELIDDEDGDHQDACVVRYPSFLPGRAYVVTVTPKEDA